MQYTQEGSWGNLCMELKYYFSIFWKMAVTRSVYRWTMDDSGPNTQLLGIFRDFWVQWQLCIHLPLQFNHTKDIFAKNPVKMFVHTKNNTYNLVSMQKFKFMSVVWDNQHFKTCTKTSLWETILKALKEMRDYTSFSLMKVQSEWPSPALDTMSHFLISNHCNWPVT